jgi:microcystin-dependent protein
VTTTGNINAAGSIQESGNDLLPAGVIVMWSGTTAPAGWALCNGSGGTPDLRNRFVVGSGSTYASGATGGATTHQHSVDPANTATTSNGSHNHTVNPATVTASISLNSGGTASINPTAGVSRILVDLPLLTVNLEPDHQHAVDIAPTTTTPGSSLPPYYALAYIIKL